jgi:hypothetical protein
MELPQLPHLKSMDVVHCRKKCVHAAEPMNEKKRDDLGFSDEVYLFSLISTRRGCYL